MFHRQARKVVWSSAIRETSLFAPTTSNSVPINTARRLVGILGLERNASVYVNGTPIRRFSHLISPIELDRCPGVHVPTRGPFRLFSSGSASGSSGRKPPILKNEALLVTLRKQFPKANGPTEIHVRLVVDEAGETPSTVMVCTLAEAIEVSLDRMTDLIGVALNNDPPVIRAVRLSKLEYENEQAVAKQKSAAKSKQAKTFRFRAGIDENDLQRKIQTMTKFLEQGIECEYTVFSKARTLRENSVAGTDLVDRIQEMVAGCAVQKRAPQTNEQGNHIRVCLVPKKN